MQPTADHPLWKHLLAGAGAGLLVGGVIALATSLSPLAALDRRALALIALSISLPLGAALAFAPKTLKQAGLPAFRAIAAAASLSLAMAAADPTLALALLLWVCPAAIVGASLASLDRRGVTGLIASVLWLALNASPFFFQVFDGTAYGAGARRWALEGCPWLGFAQANLAMDAGQALDPLRQEVLYMGHFSALTDMPAMGLLSSGTLWWLAVLAVAAALVRRAPTAKPAGLAAGNQA